MARRRWTPQRFVTLRRIRVAACAAALVVASSATFAFTARKTVALSINGETRTVSTYAMSVDRLLEEQHVNVRSHDLVQSTSGGQLTNHAVVTVRSAYQTTIVIDGTEVPFWTVATSADQLLGFFNANEHDAAKITVDIGNVYNRLTGGLVINANGPVTVIADGKSSVVDNGKLPAASILDAKGITLGKEDRVGVEKDGSKTILRVQRITHGQETRTVTIAHGTQTIIDPSLKPGESVIRQEGRDGVKTQVYNVTYADGKAESETLASETVTTMALDTIVAVGPEQVADPADPDDTDDGGSGSNNGANSGDGGSTNSGDQGSDQGGNSNSADNGSANSGGNAANGGGDQTNGSNSGNSGTGNTGTGSETKPGNGSNGSSGTTQKPNNNSGSSNGGNSNGGNSGNGSNNGNSGNTGNSGNGNSNSGNSNSGNSGSSASGRLWHATVAQAKAYAAGAAAQRGWTGDDWDKLVKLWTRESQWLWYAENPYSGAYGIPQSLPGDKMAQFGANWRDDAAVQIDWGLWYIAQRYGSPSKAWAHSEAVGWY